MSRIYEEPDLVSSQKLACKKFCLRVLKKFLALPNMPPCLVKDVVRRHTGPSEQERRPRAELQTVPGRFGHQPAGIKTGARGASLEVPHRLAGSPAA